MNLIIDAGNTLVKLAVFEGDTLVHRQQMQQDRMAREVKEICDRFPRIERAMLSSVGQPDQKMFKVLSVFCSVFVLDHTFKTPFKNSYATPHTLGVDRMALATAAFYHNPKGNTLVIDAGTCVTYDMVNDYGEYLGGAISPGLTMRFRALHEQTSRLPLLGAKGPFNLIGNSTESSIRSGVINGICLEIDGVIDQYRSRFTDLTVILTGGDAHFLSKRLKNTIFALSNFLLEGLNHLLEYNKP